MAILEAPACANARTIPWPIPRAPPVTRIHIIRNDDDDLLITYHVTQLTNTILAIKTKCIMGGVLFCGHL